ncbi:Mur ligase family protein [Microvirga sp. 2YAF29]|uniref:Mur ligase family protein n=1 Tax=Microvirga sp. 2YAF29 TaxID=3233031 RepID=UPI003F9B2689
MSEPILWTAEEVQRVTGGTWLELNPQGRKYRRCTFPTKYLDSDCVVIHVHGPGWPDKCIDGSHQRGMTSDDLIRRIQNYSNTMVITSQRPTMPTGTPVLLVRSTYDALFALAVYQRSRYEGRIIGITGTAGKSSTRDFLAALLDIKVPTFASFGNWNAIEGNALSLANLPPKGELAVIEISAGAIDGLRRRNSLELVRHHDAIITSIGVNLTSKTPTAKYVAEIKSMLFSALPDDGCAYFSSAVQEIETLIASAGSHKRRIVGRPGESSISVEIVGEELGKTHLRISFLDYTADVSTNIIGSGQLSNLALALQCAADLGADPRKLVEKVSEITLQKRKMEVKNYTLSDKSVHLLNDCHNATLVSFSSALNYLDRLSRGFRNQIFVIGKIVHIEGWEKHVYETLSHDLKRCNPKTVILFADGLDPLEHELKSLNMNVLRATDAKEALKLIRRNITDQTLIFLKGSHRGTEMRELGDSLQKHLRKRSVEYASANA